MFWKKQDKEIYEIGQTAMDGLSSLVDENHRDAAQVLVATIIKCDWDLFANEKKRIDFKNGLTCFALNAVFGAFFFLLVKGYEDEIEKLKAENE
jgi:hypothetical protein